MEEEYAKNSQSRKWLLTLNNSDERGCTARELEAPMSELTLAYWCAADEVGAETGTFHTHAFVYSPSPIRFSRLKKLFPSAHIDRANGSAAQDRDYVGKQGKWSLDPKADTRVEGSFIERGEVPREREAGGDRKERLYSMIEQGLTADEIISIDRSFIYQAKTIDDLVQRRLAAKYRNVNRPLETAYVFGPTNVGKTYGILEEHRGEGVCRITSYRNGAVNFDAYRSEPVLVFEEFNSQIKIEEMLNYLDIYPLMLPARFHDRVACYRKVYITSNISLEMQYPDVQRTRPQTWRAFLRRIHRVIEYRADGSRSLIETKGLDHA